VISGEVLTFGVLIVLVIVIAFVGRRIQTVHPPPGAGSSGGTDDRRPK
jgi:hypothetical protein